jgi:hypothetical protein
MKALLGMLLLAAVAFGLGGCTVLPFGREETSPARFDAIDELSGDYGGVGIGSSPKEIMRVFGEIEPLVREGPFQPTGAVDFRGPSFIRTEVGYAYEDVLFWLSSSDRKIAGFQVTGAGASTARGIEIGDDLDDVRARYREIRCGQAPAGESPIFGNTTFPYCSGKVAPGRWIWFGDDPVANISVSSARFSHP